MAFDSQMQQLPTKQYKSDEAREYADLLSVGNDLSFVIASTERLLEELNKPNNEQDALTVRAFWSAAAIAYVRCFGTGKRQGLGKDVFDNLADAAPAHQHLKDTRDKHVAHSVNAFEEVMVGFVLGCAPNAGVEAVGNLFIFSICDDAGGVRNLQILARHALAAIQPRMETLKDSLLRIGKNMSREELDKLPPLGIRVKDQPGQPRP